MADNEARTARQKALAEKKRRLEELKARRQNRPSASANTSSASDASNGGNNNLDEYIDSLLKTSAPGLAPVASGTNSAEESAVDTTENAVANNASEDKANNNETQIIANTNNENDESTQAAAAVVAPPPAQPKVETFEIATQCEEDDFPPPSVVDEDEEAKDDLNDGDAIDETVNTTSMTDDSIHNMEQTMAQLSLEEKQTLLNSPPFAHFLSTASKRVERLLGAKDEGLMYGLFQERGWAHSDFSMDYAVQDSKLAEENENDMEEEEQQLFQSGGFFTAMATYTCPKWTNGRNVTDVEWCPSHKEWVLASYNAVVQNHPSSTTTAATTAAAGGGGVATRNLSPNEQFSSAFTTPSSNTIPNEGIIAIYNLTMPERPEHIFCSGCPIVHSQFHPVEHPKLILGGGTSGQVLVWDARVGRYPVQRSGMGGKGHDVDLVGMKVLGGGSSGGIVGGGGGSLSTCKLVTASSDGKVNYWSVSNLRDPVEQVKVDANLSCLDVLQQDGGNEGVICGDERGGLHAIFASSGRDGGSGGGSTKRVVRTIHSGGVFGNKSLDDVTSLEGDAGDDALDLGHFGMVTAIAARPTIANANTRSSMKETTSSSMSKGFLRGAGGLIVTTGVDWSTKLWAPGYTDAPLMSFLSNSYDYMSDVQWSPVHPSVFATASSNGTVNIWDLASTIDQPVSGTEGISIDGPNGADYSSRQGLNRLKWSADGKRMAVASGDKLHVLGVGEDVWKTKGDEEGRVMNNLLSRGLIQE